MVILILRVNGKIKDLLISRKISSAKLSQFLEVLFLEVFKAQNTTFLQQLFLIFDPFTLRGIGLKVPN